MTEVELEYWDGEIRSTITGLYNRGLLDKTDAEYEMIAFSEIVRLAKIGISHGLKDTAPYARGSDASKEVAQKIRSKLSGIRLNVFEYIKSMGVNGATGSEIAEALDILPYTAKPRCTELAQAGYIVNSGKLRHNKNKRNETVWEVKQCQSVQLSMTI
jgi:hypothetical protein